MDQMKPIFSDTVLHVRASHGVPFLVRLVREGERYGLNRCIEHGTDPRALKDAGPLVEFYDLRYPMHGEPGQFVSRYYVDTVLGRDDYSKRIGNTNPRCGLLLDGGNPDTWTVDAATMDVVRAWLTHHVPADPGQESAK